MGLDVVLKCIERLNGLIEAETIPGVGTQFIIQLPLTLAIISALMVEVAGRTYALPLASVVESLRFRRDEITRMNGRDTLRIRDRIVPLLHLGTAVRPPRSAGPVDAPYAVVLGRGEKRIGLAVDRLKGQQEIVIKALDPLGVRRGFRPRGGHHHGRRQRGADPRHPVALRERRVLSPGGAAHRQPGRGLGDVRSPLRASRQALPQDARSRATSS